MNDLWWIDLDDGSGIGCRAPGELTIVDCHGQPFSAEIDDSTLYRLIGCLAHDPSAWTVLHGPAAVVVAHVTAGRDGTVAVYVHAFDRSAALAPIYLSAADRRELARTLNV